jgi:cell division inhibitor SepF
MSMLRNVLTYMGLGPDEDYDDGYPYDPADDVDDDEEIDQPKPAPRSSGRAASTIDVTDGARSPGAHGGPPTDRRAQSPGSSPGERRPQAGANRHPPRRAPARQRPPIDDPPTEPLPRRGRHDLTDPAPTRPLRAVPPASLGDSASGITIRPVPSLPEEPSAPAGPAQVKPRALSPQSFGDAKTLADAFKDDVPVIMNLQGVERDLARRLIDFASGICYALDGGMEKIAPQVFLLTPSSVEVSDEDRRRLEQRNYRH